MSRMSSDDCSEPRFRPPTIGGEPGSPVLERVSPARATRSGTSTHWRISTDETRSDWCAPGSAVLRDGYLARANDCTQIAYDRRPHQDIALKPVRPPESPAGGFTRRC